MYLYIRTLGWKRLFGQKKKQHPSPGDEASTAEGCSRQSREKGVTSGTRSKQQTEWWTSSRARSFMLQTSSKSMFSTAQRQPSYHRTCVYTVLLSWKNGMTISDGKLEQLTRSTNSRRGFAYCDDMLCLRPHRTLNLPDHLKARAGLSIILCVSFYIFEKVLFRSSNSFSNVLLACWTRHTDNNSILPEPSLCMVS